MKGLQGILHTHFPEDEDPSGLLGFGQGVEDTWDELNWAQKVGMSPIGWPVTDLIGLGGDFADLVQNPDRHNMLTPMGMIAGMVAGAPPAGFTTRMIKQGVRTDGALNKMMKAYAVDVPVRHWGDGTLEAVDPQKWGSRAGSMATNKEYNRVRGGGIPRTYTYTLDQPTRKGVPTADAPESMLGKEATDFIVPDAYDAVADPLHLREQARIYEEGRNKYGFVPESAITNRYEKLIKEKGFSAAYYPDYGQVHIFDNLKLRTPDGGLPAPKELLRLEHIPRTNEMLQPTGSRLLKNTERKSIKAATAAAGENITPGDVKDLQNNIVRYRRRYSGPEWQDIEYRVKYDHKNKKLTYEPNLVPGRTGFTYSYGPDGKPLTGSARHAEVDRLGNALAKEIHEAYNRGDEIGALVRDARRWYDVKDRLRRVYGGRAGVYGEAQGATSPRTKVGLNFEYADDFFDRYVKGEFDELLERVDKYLVAGGDFSKIPNEMVPKRGDALYGHHGKRLLQVVYDDFRQVKAGMAPKMRNYGATFHGDSIDPTIDVWAARNVQRLSGKPLPPPMVASVRGEYLGSAPGKPVTTTAKGPTTAPDVPWEGDLEPGVTVKPTKVRGTITGISDEYGVGFDVYVDATRKLRELDPAKFGHLTPEQLQAMAWIHEKRLWESRGWTSVDPEPHIGPMIEKAAEGRTRLVGGITESTTGDVDVYTRKQSKETLKKATPGAKVEDTAGRFMGWNEPAIDYEVIADKRDYLRMDRATRGVKDVAEKNQQWQSFMARVLDDPMAKNARPGIEVYWAPNSPVQDSVMDRLNKGGVDGLTLIKDGRGNYVGVRAMWMPEYAGADRMRVYVDNPDLLYGDAKAFGNKVKNVAKELEDVEGVTAALPTHFDVRAMARAHEVPRFKGTGMSNRLPHHARTQTYLKGMPSTFPADPYSRVRPPTFASTPSLKDEIKRALWEQLGQPRQSLP